MICHRRTQAAVGMAEDRQAFIEPRVPAWIAGFIQPGKKLPGGSLLEPRVCRPHQHKTIRRRVRLGSIMRVGIDELVPRARISTAKVHEAYQTELGECPVRQCPGFPLVAGPCEPGFTALLIGMSKPKVKDIANRDNPP